MKKLPDKALILFFIIAACVSLAIYIGYIKGIPTLYTHLFYIPILLTGIWYGRKAIYTGFFFSTVHILVTHFSLIPVSVNELGRAGAFILVAYVIGSISEARAKEENKILIEKNFSANIIATVPNSLLVLDHDLRIKSVNRTFCETFKTEIEKVMGSNIADVLQDKDGTIVPELTRIIGTDELLENFEIHYRPEMTDELILNINAKEILFEEEVLVVIEDVTARKRAEETLRTASENTKTILEKAPFGVVVIGRDRKIKWVNDNALKMAGIENADIMLGKDCDEYLCPAQQKECPILDNRQQVDNFERIFRSKDGKEIPIIKTVTDIIFDGEDVLLETFVDITERKQAEKQIRFLSSVVEQSADGMAISDMEGNLLFVNDAWVSMHGYEKAEELIGQNLSIFHNEEQLKGDVEPFNRKVKEKGHNTGEVGHIRRDSTIFPTLMTTTLLRDENDNPIAIAGAATDITEHKQAEEALRIVNENTKTILEKAPVGIVIIGRDRMIKWVNNTALKMTGMESGNIMLGMNCAEFLCPAEQKKCPILDMGQQVDNSERILRRKDGKKIPIIKTVTEISMYGEDVLLETFIDITKLKQVEEALKKSNQELKDTQAQLLQAGKLAAMGEMAAGVVHELSQPLLGIKGFTATIHEDMKALFEDKTVLDSKFVKQMESDIDVIQRQTERMAKILNSVRSFARVSTTETIPLDINQPIEDALMLFIEQLRVHNIAIEKNLAPDLPEVMGNASQLEQVFINLITNARAAMDAKGGRGQLTISTKGSANGIYIGVEDTGIGADAETVSRMFEPFFTTRITEEGTGLGLSIIQRIINEHNGTINAKCQPGRGCKFTINLPFGPEI